ncbi:hypothetical protein Tco_0621955 [Tanacetum coccineum]
MINHVNNLEKANKEQNSESVTAELERYKERVKTFEQRLNIDFSSCEKMIDSQMDDMIKEKLALKEQVDSLEQNLSKQIKEKECLLQTFTFFKSESKEKVDKYMENEMDLEKKIVENKKGGNLLNLLVRCEMEMETTCDDVENVLKFRISVMLDWVIVYYRGYMMRSGVLAMVDGEFPLITMMCYKRV